jgi:FtsZ-interacting cell division protein ZipA
VISNRDAFEEMLRTAQQIRAALDGELRDDHRSVMTPQTIEHYRQRIHDYELRKLKAAQSRS